MRLIRSIMGLAAMLALSVGSVPAIADSIPLVRYQPNVTNYATADATAAYTNATTGSTAIAGATVTIPASTRPLTGTTASTSGVAQAVEVCYWADVTKSTASTGTISIKVNGTNQTAANRTVASSAGQTSISTCWTVARPTAASFTVALFGVSGDTNTFTVAQLHMRVQTYYFT